MPDSHFLHPEGNLFEGSRMIYNGLCQRQEYPG